MARCAALAFLVLVVLCTGQASAQWLPGGIPICPYCGHYPIICPDGAGGAYVVWQDGRNANDDVYIQRVTATGAFAPGWPAAGFPVCVLPSYQARDDLQPDGQGGAYVAWNDYRYPGNGGDIYAQRITAAGDIAPGWPLNGAPVTRAPGYQELARIASDGQGGAFVTWDDERAGLENQDIYVQHLTASGAVMDGWPADGLPIITANGAQGYPVIMPDDGGGALLAWTDLRRGVGDIYAQHITASGTIAPGWVANGLPVMLLKSIPYLVADGAGGVFVAGEIPAPYNHAYGFYVQRFTFAGAVASGWPDSGVAVCTPPDLRDGFGAASDGRGGILLSWSDYRANAAEVYALRILPDGRLAPGWTANGLRVTDHPDYDGVANIAPDGTGGAYLTWERESIPYATVNRIVVQHLTPQGAVAPGWPPNGTEIVPSGAELDYPPQIVADGHGGAIVSWDEDPYGPYAQQLVADGVVPVQFALVSAEAEPGRVMLTWYGAEAAGLSATVYRRTEDSGWQRLGSVSADGTGRLRFEDRAVAAGDRYAYRLGYGQVSGEVFTAESWVEVPALRLALESPRPNPAVGELRVEFTLPSAAPATLELLDVSGRRVVAREVGALGAGRHVLRLDEGGPIPAGLYWVRLRQGGRALTTRAAVIR